MFGQKRKVCANCSSIYMEGDKYCRFCGAPMGKPKFIPEDFACIYGPPPVRRVHNCAKCGYSWETNSMIDRAMWCPKCGGSAPAVEAEDPFFYRPVEETDIQPETEDDAE